MKDEADHIVGIDLGTTNSLISVFAEGRARTLENELSETLISSAVAVDETGTLLVGAAARERIGRDPSCGAARFKRDMGSGRIYRVAGRDMSPTELSSLVLRELRALGESVLGRRIRRAVVTVPAYFKEPQRAATIEAGAMAGLTISRIINEPTAAAIAYGLHEAETERRVAVLDLGGGTFDVTILELYARVAEVVATTGDSRLGGEDFTAALMDHLLRLAGQSGASMTAGIRAIFRGRCERAKKDLSLGTQANVEIPDGSATEWRCATRMTVSRESLAEASSELLARVRVCVRGALNQAGMLAADVEDVLLVGGATRMPCFHEAIGAVFGSRARSSADPDQIVAWGAAVQGALIQSDAAVRDFVVTDVTPFSLGIRCSRNYDGREMDNYFHPVIHRGTTIPASREERFWTVDASQSEVRIAVYQGENRFASDNEFLGEFRVRDVPPADSPDARRAVDVRFSHDANGLLEVEAAVEAADRKSAIVIERHAGRMSPREREEAVRALEALKVHPRELLPNRYVLERAQRVYAALRSEQRVGLDGALLRFDAAIAAQDIPEIDAARDALTELLDRVVASTGLE